MTYSGFLSVNVLIIYGPSPTGPALFARGALLHLCHLGVWGVSHEGRCLGPVSRGTTTQSPRQVRLSSYLPTINSTCVSKARRILGTTATSLWRVHSARHSFSWVLGAAVTPFLLCGVCVCGSANATNRQLLYGAVLRACAETGDTDTVMSLLHDMRQVGGHPSMACYIEISRYIDIDILI